MSRAGFNERDIEKSLNSLGGGSLGSPSETLPPASHILLSQKLTQFLQFFGKEVFFSGISGILLY